jgi:hypothetical protein
MVVNNFWSEPMSETHSIPLRLPKKLYESLKQTAAAKGRSVNAEVIDCLQEMLPDFDNFFDKVLAGSHGARWITSEDEQTPAGALVRLVPELQDSLIAESQLLSQAQQLRTTQSRALHAIWSQALMGYRSEKNPKQTHQPFGILLPKDDSIGVQSLHTSSYLKAEAAAKAVTKLLSQKRLETNVRWRSVESLISENAERLR